MSCTSTDGAPAPNVDLRFVGCGRYAAESKHAGGYTRRQHLIVRRLSSELDDGALQRTDEGERDDSGRRAGGDRSRSASGFDEAGAALNETFGDPLEVTSDRVILAAELES
jgi:hypothetical protein